MKSLIKTYFILNITLPIFFIFSSQPVLANQEQIKNLLSQRLELLEESLRLGRLRFQAGVGELEDIRQILPEILEVRLRIVDSFELKNRKKEIIQVFEASLKEALQIEKDVKLLERAGLGTRFDVLVIESWRLDLQIQLEREKGSLEQR